MELRTGIDMLEIRRMARSMRSPRFLQRCFGSEELRQFAERGGRANFLAGSFCAKEALVKALGIGLGGFPLPEAQVLRDETGRPYFCFSGKAKEWIGKTGYSFDLSITHTKEYAAACVVAYTQDKRG